MSDFTATKVNEQLNYQRKFISKHKAEVTIPTIPYEGFDVYSPDTRIKPWSLLELIISARIFTQWPAQKADKPDDSFLDAHKLLSVPDQNIYFVSLQLDISRAFHDHRTPKYPLIVEQELIYVGNSSATKRYFLKHPDLPESFACCSFDDVFVRKSSGKGMPLPDWWKDKYSFVNDFNEKPPRVIKVDPMHGCKIFENTFRVEFDDLDHNLHTTSSSYLRFCVNAAFRNIYLPLFESCNKSEYATSENHSESQSKYKNVTSDVFNAGIKSVLMQFSRETRFGDELIVRSWEDIKSKNTLHFSVVKNGAKQCCYVRIEFYESDDKYPKSHL